MQLSFSKSLFLNILPLASVSPPAIRKNGSKMGRCSRVYSPFSKPMLAGVTTKTPAGVGS